MKTYIHDEIEIYIFESYVIGARTYCILSGDDALLIDAVLTKELVPFLNERNIKKITVLLTHGHYDHILGLEELRNKFPVTVGCLDLSKEVLEDPRKNLTAVATLINEMRRKKYNLD